MSVDVTVTDDGKLQATIIGPNGSVAGPALTIEAVQALAARIPDAINAVARQGLTSQVRALTDILLATPDTLNATITITGTALEATVDPDTFTRLQAALDVTPDPDTGALTSGAITVLPA